MGRGALRRAGARRLHGEGRRAPDRDRDASAEVGAVDLRVPLELCPVLTETPSIPPSTAPPTGKATRIVQDTEGNEYRVDDPFLTVERIEKGSVQQQGVNWIISLTLPERDGTVFADWTTTHVGDQVAVIADNEVIFAPQIAEPIPGNEIQIAADYTRDEAEDFLNDITGR